MTNCSENIIRVFASPPIKSAHETIQQSIENPEPKCNDKIILCWQFNNNEGVI